MHLVAIRRKFYEENRFIASGLFNALNGSKNVARARMFSTGALRYDTVCCRGFQQIWMRLVVFLVEIAGRRSGAVIDRETSIN
jgi:hypothetical protein